jgi:archaellum biogenesis protein FlaJ (TadC family)
MKETDYPSLYQAANNAAVKTQSWYLNAVKFYLILLLVGALLTKFAPKDITWSIFAAIVLLITLALSIYQAFKRFDIIWYNGRAVAESVKTRTWRFIMQAEPYQATTTYPIIARHFTNDVSEILNENKELGKYLTDNGSADSITIEMLNIRSMDLLNRKEYYKKNRVDEQRKWYAKKARWNNRQSIIWFSLMIGANSLAIIFVILQVAYPDNDDFPVEIFIALAGSILTWMQIKRFQDLATSYSLTAHEITLIRQNIDFCNTETELSDYVKDAENAFSREHTQWVARKDK